MGENSSVDWDVGYLKTYALLTDRVARSLSQKYRTLAVSYVYIELCRPTHALSDITIIIFYTGQRAKIPDSSVN